MIVGLKIYRKTDVSRKFSEDDHLLDTAKIKGTQIVPKHHTEAMDWYSRDCGQMSSVGGGLNGRL